MENSNAQNFVVYAEWWEAISMLSNEQKGVLFQAMFSTSTGQCAMPEMDTSTKMAFLLIRPRIVAAQEKYAAKVAANRENGKKGGRPAKPVEDDKINPEETSEKPKNPTVSLGNPTDNPKTHNISIRNNIINTPLTPLEGDGEQKPTSLSLFTLASAEPDVVQGTSPSAETGKGAQRSKRKVKGADLPPYTAWFEECWKAYPRRSGKANAWRAFYELDELGEIPPDMVQRIKNRCFEQDWQRGIKNPEEERYIPHMATWLHARGWEDDGCESVVDHRNTPEDIRRNEIMGLYNFGMPMNGDTLEQAKQRSIEMNLALDAAGL